MAMSENEAIKVLEKPSKHIRMVHKTKNEMEFYTFSSDLVEAFETAIQALEEIQQYRAIGTIDEFKALKEKVEPKKPLPKGTHKGIDNFYCPNCNHPLTNRHEQCELPYCDICGQKLDWSE